MAIESAGNRGAAINVQAKYSESRLLSEEKLWEKALKYIGLYLPLIFWVLITFFPFYYMLLVSSKTSSQIFSNPPQLLLMADSFQNFITNYTSLMNKTPFWNALMNSLYIATMTTLLTLFFCSLGGYGFAMYNFKGKNMMFRFMMLTLMVPSVVGIIPYFVMMKTFGWLNQAKALYIPAIANAYGIFLMRQYVESAIPKDLVESARIDGASEFGIFWRIVLPLISPGLGALGMITFLGSWNSFFNALVLMTKRTAFTVPVALSSLKGQNDVDYGAIMVGTVITVFPILLVFIIMAKQIIAELTEGALKG
jgi:multiple sugar transport system permease protein